MKKQFFAVLLFLWFLPTAHAEIKDLVYDGKEIYLHVKKDHLTTVIFPEPVNAIIRGFAADSFVIQRNDQAPDTLELMPTDTETAEMTARGVSGEEYVLRCIGKDDFYTKLTIHRLAASVNKREEKTIVSPMSVAPEVVIPKQASAIVALTPTELPPELNLKVTLKGNDLPLKVYLSTISQVTHYNIITTKDIDDQKTSINLENIEVWRVLKSLLYKFGYGFKVSEDDLVITETETRIFNIDMPAVDQTFTDETSNESYANNTANASINANSNQQNEQVNVGTKIYYENKSQNISLWSDLENNIKSMLTPKLGSYSLNKATGTIIVTDKPQVLDKISDLVAMVNTTLSKQQSFEIQIIEVALNDDFETGIDWNTIAKSVAGLNNITASTNFNASGFLSGQLLTLSATGPQATSGISSGGISVVLKALDSQGSVNVISKPTITVSNLFPCIIQSVTSIPYISGVGTTIGNTASQSDVTTSEVSEGLTMRLEGKIEDNKTVLNISAAENTLDSMTTIPVGGGLSIQEPQVSTKSITTNVSVQSDRSLILGGLMSTTKNNTIQGIPYLDKIPLLGNAFQYRGKLSQKTELVIIITPKKMVRNL